MIIVTGGAGFIGSNLINYLMKHGHDNVVSSDFLNKKNNYYFSKQKPIEVEPKGLEIFLKKFKKEIKIIVHLGAISSTTNTDVHSILNNNILLTINLKNWCDKNGVRFIYASSAATYGDGNNGFLDDSKSDYLSKLMPLNLYGWSKHIVDLKLFKKYKKSHKQFVGLKFFNVYGPNEYHKNEMKSIVSEDSEFEFYSAMAFIRFDHDK